MKFIVRCAGGAEMCCSSSSMTVSRRQKSWQPTNACVKLELNPVQFETRSPERCRWERLPRMVPLAREAELRFPNWTRFRLQKTCHNEKLCAIVSEGAAALTY